MGTVWVGSKSLISSMQEKTHSASPLSSDGLHTPGHPVGSSFPSSRYTSIYKQRNIGGNVVVNSSCFLRETQLALQKPGKGCFIHVLVTTKCLHGPETTQSRDILFRTVLSSPCMVHGMHTNGLFSSISVILEKSTPRSRRFPAQL